MLKLDHLPYYWQLMRGDKPIGFFLLWWPVMWALWIAGQGWPSMANVIIFTLGSFLMRSAGCVINDYADRDIDKHVERTKNRPLTSGLVSTKETLLLCALLCLGAFILVCFTNQKTIEMAFVGAALAILYPFTKRWFVFPQFFLGAAFSWGVVMVFAAEEREINFPVYVLYAAVLLWTVAYDTFYAMVDRQDDLKLNVKSTAIWFAEYDRLITALLQISVISLLLFLGEYYHFSSVYFIFVFIASLLFVYQQYLIKDYDRAKCFQAFLNNHWVGALIFVAILAHYYL